MIKNVGGDGSTLYTNCSRGTGLGFVVLFSLWMANLALFTCREDQNVVLGLLWGSGCLSLMLFAWLEVVFRTAVGNYYLQGRNKRKLCNQSILACASELSNHTVTLLLSWKQEHICMWINKWLSPCVNLAPSESFISCVYFLSRDIPPSLKGRAVCLNCNIVPYQVPVGGLRLSGRAFCV